MIRRYIQRYQGRNIAPLAPEEFSWLQLPFILNDFKGHSSVSLSPALT